MSVTFYGPREYVDEITTFYLSIYLFIQHCDLWDTGHTPSASYSYPSLLSGECLWIGENGGITQI